MQDAIELLEARLASGVVGLEARVQALEASQQRAPQPHQAATQGEPGGPACCATAHQGAPGNPRPGPPAAAAPHLLLDRVAAMEAAMAEQGRAVADLLAVLRPQGAPTVGEAGAAAPAPVPAPSPAPVQAAVAALVPAKKAVVAQQLHQRKSLLVKRSVLGDPTRSAGAPLDASLSAAPLPRLKATHAAGRAQQVAVATAREQLALQAARAREEETETQPAWVTMLVVLGWTMLAVLGLSAVVVGALAVAVKQGRLTDSDLDFLFK